MSSRSGTPGATSASASDRAYSYVKERILDGQFEGGALISEGEIASSLKISRTPVREAFLRLQTEGWMRLYPKRGAAITPIKPREIDQVLEARSLIESHSAGEVCRDPERAAGLVEDLRAVLRLQREHTAAGDLPGFARADAEFHQLIVAAGSNELLSDFYAGLRDRQRRMTLNSMTRSSDATTRILEQHEILIDLIANCDSTGFTTAIASHLGDIHRSG